jgi:hypothetical protein
MELFGICILQWLEIYYLIGFTVKFSFKSVFKFSLVYRVGSKSAFSRVFNFKTFPSGDDFSYRVCIFGDLGVDNGVSLIYLAREAEQRHFDVIIHVGDIAYDLHRCVLNIEYIDAYFI